jgi:hypothetical protein
MWIAVMVLGPGGAGDGVARPQFATVKPIKLGTPTRRYFDGPAEVVSGGGASGLIVSQAIAVPANARGGRAEEGRSQVTVVGEDRGALRNVDRGLADARSDGDRVIVQTEQLFRAFGKGRYRNFGYTELLEPRQVGPFVGTPIFGPFGPGDGSAAPARRLTREEIDRLKQERIYQMFESLRPIEDRFPRPAGQ